MNPILKQLNELGYIALSQPLNFVGCDYGIVRASAGDMLIGIFSHQLALVEYNPDVDYKTMGLYTILNPYLMFSGDTKFVVHDKCSLPKIEGVIYLKHFSA